MKRVAVPMQKKNAFPITKIKKNFRCQHQNYKRLALLMQQLKKFLLPVQKFKKNCIPNAGNKKNLHFQCKK